MWEKLRKKGSQALADRRLAKSNNQSQQPDLRKSSVFEQEVCFSRRSRRLLIASTSVLGDVESKCRESVKRTADYQEFSRPLRGLNSIRRVVPALKCWAISSRPPWGLYVGRLCKADLQVLRLSA